jgi:hypothetical protein
MYQGRLSNVCGPKVFCNTEFWLIFIVMYINPSNFSTYSDLVSLRQTLNSD